MQFQAQPSQPMGMIIQSPSQPLPVGAYISSQQGQSIVMPQGYIMVMGPNGVPTPMYMMMPGQGMAAVPVQMPSQHYIAAPPPPAAGQPAAAQVKPEEKKDPRALPANVPSTAAAPKVVKPAFGHLRVGVHSAKGLLNTKCCGDQDISVTLILGNHMERTPVSRSGGTAPSWKSVPTYTLGIGDSPKAHYDQLVVLVNVPGTFCDETVGEAKIGIEKIAQDTLEHKKIDQQWFILGRKNSPNAKGGEVCLSLRYVAPLLVTVHSAVNLQDVQLIGKQDPYCKLRLRGCTIQGESGERKTKVHDDGGTTPVWNDTFNFNILDEEELAIAQAELKTKPKSIQDNAPRPGLEINVWDENVIIDKAIAHCFVEYAEITKHRKAGKPVELQLFKGEAADKSNIPSGKITVSFI